MLGEIRDNQLNTLIQGIVQRIAHKVRGPGTIAISHYGGLYRLVLDEDEEFLANPRYVPANLLQFTRDNFCLLSIWTDSTYLVLTISFGRAAI